MPDRAVVLVSGGLDSCVTAAIARQNFSPSFLHLNYRQRTEKSELQAFTNIADFYSVKDRLVIDADFFGQIGGSALTDRRLKLSPANLHSESVPNTYVPFRNANILAMAVSWAEVLGAKAVFIGAVEEDSSGYPDCREDFFTAFNQLIRLGTKPETDISIRTPLLHLKKSEIVRQGIALNAPLHLTWSCYQNEQEACGICDSCALRLRGFRQAGAEDPIPYKSRPVY